MILEEDTKLVKQLEEEVASLRKVTQEQNIKINNLQAKIDEKIDELRLVQNKYSQIQQDHRQHMSLMNKKMN